MAAPCSRCGHFAIFFLLWFLLSFFLFSSPILSGRRVDVCHTSTRGVVLVPIYNVGLACAACGSLEIQDAKMTQKSPSRHNRTSLRAESWNLRNKVCIDNRKKLVKQQYLLHMSAQYGELRSTSGWDRFESLGDPSKFQRLSRLGSVTAGHSGTSSGSGRQPNFAALNIGRHLYSAGRPSLSALAHILVAVLLLMTWYFAVTVHTLSHEFSSFFFFVAYAVCTYVRMLYVHIFTAAYIEQAIIFLPCGFFPSFFLSFSSANLSGRRVDVYRSSTHGVTLMRI